MVDTINPNTNQPDSWEGGAPVPTPENRFYGGFNLPEETKINLANGTQGVGLPPTPGATSPQPQIPVGPQAVQDVAAPVASAEVKHTAYTNTSDMINWRGILVIVILGIVATAIAGVGLYFGLSASNSSKLKVQQDQLDTIKNQLIVLEEAPNPLELPVTEVVPPETTAPVETTPEVIPTPIPVETPVIVPSTPPTTQTPGGSLGTG